MKKTNSDYFNIIGQSPLFVELRFYGHFRLGYFKIIHFKRKEINRCVINLIRLCLKFV